MNFKQANGENFAQGRTQPIQFLVIHYTANNGDTVQNNLDYFAGNAVGASAHYFVDENGYGQSVKDADTAWHCGASSYRHEACRNANSIGMELCSRKDSRGNYYFLDQTVYNAAALARQLMQTYGIDRAHVLRHYDVTGKQCPAPMVDNPTLWENFLNLLEDKTVTYAEAIETVKEKTGLSDATMQFLTSYIWREDLLKKLAQAMK
jgi:N-acetylmuramoyl-L-alanine amidase CwlA